MEKLPLDAFIEYFCDDERKSKKFCFILGAGASISSGIPTGEKLLKIWMAKLDGIYKNNPKYLSWKNDIDMSDSAKDYSAIFDKMFRLNKKDGFEFLEKIMEGKEPSCGYSVLAQILAKNQHNIVITTNFDSLTEDALFIYTEKKPLVIGHEALADYIDVSSSRPIIVKIHQDLYLGPKNGNEGTSELAENFKKNLTEIFKHYTPLVIGYGGNDRSFMDFLESLDEIEGGIFWFYRGNSKAPSKRIQDLAEKFEGSFVTIPSFDDLMMQIGDKLELERLDEKIVEIAKHRAKNYLEQIKQVTEGKESSEETKDAIFDMFSKGVKDTWYYFMLSMKEAKIVMDDETYQAEIKNSPDDSELHHKYAGFLRYTRKKYDEAEKIYKKAIELEPDNVNYIGDYATFLHNIRKQYNKAEEFYKKTIELDSNHANCIGNYARFLHYIRKDYEQAENFYEKAIELDPNGTNGVNKISNYAIFLCYVRKDYEQAEQFYKKAIELSPMDANKIGNYANFLRNIQKNYDKAEELYKRTIDLAPKDANKIGRYAAFLHYIRKNYDKAEDLYKKAIELAPNHVGFLNNYAILLSDIRKEYHQAEVFYEKIFELEPKNANRRGNYAKFLIATRELDEAENVIQEAFTLNKNVNEILDLELWFYRYAVFFDKYKESEESIEVLLNKDIKSIGWYLDDVLEVAKEWEHPNHDNLCKLAKRITIL